MCSSDLSRDVIVGTSARECSRSKPHGMSTMTSGREHSRALVPTMTSREGFDDLPCAAEGGVIAVDGSAYFNRPGPRITRGLEILATALRARPVAR